MKDNFGIERCTYCKNPFISNEAFSPDGNGGIMHRECLKRFELLESRSHNEE